MADENGIPIRFGYYEMLKTIGKGNFAVVKLARHTIINLQVAIKVISIKSLDADQLRKLHREIDIMKRVGSHKNVVRLYQVMHSDRHVMLVTEYCEGGELFEQLVNKGRLSEKNSRFYFHQIVDAVKYLHSNGIVHRDLKAENLLLTSDFKCVKLADFGFSNYYSNQSFLATWCGSPPYAAPELFEGKQYNGPKADIWSLGVVLYVLVCGSLPFDGNTLQSLKMRVLSGKFRIPYFMSRDCEHLIRHMLVIDPDKRFSLQQIKQHRWMLDSTNQNSSEKLSDKLKNFHISSRKEKNTNTLRNDEDDDIDSSLVEWIASELNVSLSSVLESVKSRSFDEYYALYCLVNDTSHCVTTLSAPPSPPLLPIVPSTNQRKSSITTGIVEREPTSLTPNISNVRRHTCPDANTADTNSCSINPMNAPTLFLTPPVITTPATMAPPMSNLPLAPPNYPLAMDLLKPPPVLLLANNNMGRRASDGQANYARTHSETSRNIGVGIGTYGNNSVQKGVTSQQTSPPISYMKRKRHSLTDTNELISRQRRMQLAQANLNAERSRRRASDGSTAGVFQHQPISIPTLQNELRTLCVSSPPSLHTSPIHASSMTANHQTLQSHHISAISNSSATSLPPSSPPPTLPQISEENKNENDIETIIESHSASIAQQQQQNTSTTKMHKSTKISGLIQQQHQRYVGSPIPLITPPQSFRSSPVTSPNHATPSISVTDELGTSQFPILPPPIDFQLANSHPNLDKDPASPRVSTDLIFNRLHRWRNDEKFIALSSSSGSSEKVVAEFSVNNFPSYSNLNFDINHHNRSENHLKEQSLVIPDSLSFDSHPQYNSLQCVPCVLNNKHLTTTDSGSICINDTKTAAKLLSRFGHDDKTNCYERHILNFGQTDLQISIEWNELQ